jgi:hypothetical protein
VLTNEVDDAPAVVSLLDVSESECGHFRSTEATAEQNGEDSAIA